MKSKVLSALALSLAFAARLVPCQCAELNAAEPVVVVELFTSEGCSSCPAADDLMSKLMRSDLLKGLSVVFIGQHVDYWNYLGWNDRFSNSRFSARQNDYAKILHQNSVYTPEMIVDGSAGFLGSDESAAVREIKSAISQPKAKLSSSKISAANAATQVIVNISEIPPQFLKRKSLLMAALVADNQVSDVRSGENTGRRLVHDAVDLKLSVVGTVEPGNRDTLKIPFELHSDSNWNKEKARLVIFVQDPATLKIWGATALNLS